MSRWKIILWIVLALPVLALFGFIEFYLPGREVVRVSDVEIVRVNMEGTTRPTQGPTRDLRLISTERVSDGATRVFRNEDTGWGWPPYFKFNSGDVSGQAANFARAEPRPAVLVTYYGWRIPMLSMYPNVVSLRQVDPDHLPLPIFNILFWVVLIGLIGFVTLRVRRWRRRRAVPPDMPA